VKFQICRSKVSAGKVGKFMHSTVIDGIGASSCVRLCIVLCLLALVPQRACDDKQVRQHAHRFVFMHVSVPKVVMCRSVACLRLFYGMLHSDICLLG